MGDTALLLLLLLLLLHSRAVGRNPTLHEAMQPLPAAQAVRSDARDSIALVRRHRNEDAGGHWKYADISP